MTEQSNSGQRYRQLHILVDPDFSAEQYDDAMRRLVGIPGVHVRGYLLHRGSCVYDSKSLLLDGSGKTVAVQG